MRCIILFTKNTLVLANKDNKNNIAFNILKLLGFIILNNFYNG